MFFFKLFNNNSPLVFILMPILMFLLWGKALVLGSYFAFPFEEQQMPFYYIISNFIGENTYLQVILGFILIAIQVVLLIRLNVKYILIENRSFLPAFIFILLTGCFFQMQRQHPALWANIFILFAIDRLFLTYRRENTFSEVFDVSFLLSIGSLFYFNTIWFVIVFWIAFMIVKPFKIAEWFISIMGLIIPYIFVSSYYYLFDKLPVFSELIKNNIISFHNKTLYFNTYYYVFFMFLLFMILLSFFYFIQGINIKKVAIRRYYTVLILFICSCTTLFIAIRSTAQELFIFAGLPISFMLSFFLISLKRKWLKEAYIVIFIALIILVQIIKK